MWQLSIPKLGTIQAKTHSLRCTYIERREALGDPLRRRGFYLRVEHPTAQREAEIVALRTPDSVRNFHAGMAGLAQALRGWSLEKPPSVSEILDLREALKEFSALRRLVRICAMLFCRYWPRPKLTAASCYCETASPASCTTLSNTRR